MKPSLGYMTVGTKAEAKEIVVALLEDELIACATILDGAESFFTWEDAIHHAKENVVLFKTRVKNERKIIRLVKSMHSYECPCIIFTAIDHGNADFMRWIESTC